VVTAAWRPGGPRSYNPGVRPPLETGDSVGDLVVECELGRGAFGTVYRARDRQLQRRVALKVLAPGVADPAARDRFLAEARIVAGIASPNVVTLYRLHELDGGACALEMEIVEGPTLAEQLRAGSFAPARAERVLRDLLSGLDAAHGKGILHRDLKPANVLVGADGTSKLTDFGLAQLASEPAVPDEGPVGTPRYMAPEVLLGGSASVSSDLWSLGIVAFEMLAGESPFPVANLTAFFLAVQNAEIPALPPDTPLRLTALVAACLAKDPAARPASCDALRRILDEPALGRAVVRDTVPETRTLIGRAAELSRAEALLAEAATAPRALLVTGEAGIGKSALLDALRHRAAEEHRDWVAAALTPSHGFARALLDAFQEHAMRTRSVSGGQLLIEFLARDRRFDSVDQMVWAATQSVDAISGGRPFVLCVDDAQHLHDDDLAVLAGLTRSLAGRPWLLLVAARPSPAVARVAELAGCERLELEGLSDEDLLALLELNTDRPVPADLAARIATSSAGNPLFATELLHHAGSAAGEGTLPARLHDLVAARVETCSDDERSLLEAAAADGVAFDGRALAHVLGLPLLVVLRTLQGLCRSRMLIAPAEDGYRFVSPILQEALYADLAPELRVELHRGLAEHLDDRGGVDPGRLARHWTRCGEPARAAPHWIAVATECARRLERRRMLRVAERAGLLDPALPPERAAAHADLLLEMSAALAVADRGDEAERLLALLRRGAEEAGDEELAVRAEVQRARGSLYTKDAKEVDETLLRSATDRLAGTLTAAHAHYVLGVLAKFRQEPDAAERHLRETDRICDGLGEHALRSNALDQLGSVALRDSRYVEAEALYAEAAAVAERAGRRSNVAVAQVNRVTAAIAQGRRHGLTPILQSAVRTMELAGQHHNAAQVKVNLAALLLAEGDAEAAWTAAADAVERLRARKYPFGLCVALRTLGLVARLRGRFAEAIEASDEALALAAKLEDRLQGALAAAVRGLALVESGRQADGAHDLRRAAEAAPRDEEVGLAVLEAALLGMPADAVADAARHLEDETVAAAAVAVAKGERDAPAVVALRERLDGAPGGPSAHDGVLACALAGDEAAARRGAALAGDAGFLAWRARF